MNEKIFLQMLASIKKMNEKLNDGADLNDLCLTISLVNSEKRRVEYGNVKTHDEFISFWSNYSESFECILYSSIVRISC